MRPHITIRVRVKQPHLNSYDEEQRREDLGRGGGVDDSGGGVMPPPHTKEYVLRYGPHEIAPRLPTMRPADSWPFGDLVLFDI